MKETIQRHRKIEDRGVQEWRDELAAYAEHLSDPAEKLSLLQKYQSKKTWLKRGFLYLCDAHG